VPLGDEPLAEPAKPVEPSAPTQLDAAPTPAAPRVKIDLGGLKASSAPTEAKPTPPRVKIDTKGLKEGSAPTEAPKPKLKFDASALRREPPPTQAQPPLEPPREADDTSKPDEGDH
ncbi:MAG: hypothetical protein SNJ54_16965, partial [Anaerolineae bacterium]